MGSKKHYKRNGPELIWGKNSLYFRFEIWGWMEGVGPILGVGLLLLLLLLLLAGGAGPILEVDLAVPDPCLGSNLLFFM